MLSSLAVWYLAQSRWAQIIVRSLPIAVATYATAVVGNLIANSLTPAKPGPFTLVTVATVGVLILVVIVYAFCAEAVANVQREETLQAELELKVFSSARTFAEDAVLEDIRHLAKTDATAPNGVLVPEDPISSMFSLVRAAYRALEAHFGASKRVDERVIFEVTFMTRSYRDGEITIAAWANQDGRRPTSMNTRETNPKRYENTETAAIYREESPRGRIIEDTESHDDYAELYPGQKARIKSSIIWPVLSANNVLVGTLVMHCDRAQFFKKSEAKFWREVCEVFAKRLAQEKLRLDKAVLLREDGSITAIGANNWPEPPF